jgi:hypothetical protein
VKSFTESNPFHPIKATRNVFMSLKDLKNIESIVYNKLSGTLVVKDSIQNFAIVFKTNAAEPTSKSTHIVSSPDGVWTTTDTHLEKIICLHYEKSTKICFNL